MGCTGSLEANVSLVESNENIQPQRTTWQEVTRVGSPLCILSNNHLHSVVVFSPQKRRISVIWG